MPTTMNKEQIQAILKLKNIKFCCAHDTEPFLVCGPYLFSTVTVGWEKDPWPGNNREVPVDAEAEVLKTWASQGCPAP